ncbi:MAG: hypothetical protein CMF49_07395 [Legionellales bacterium]|nr:hypothetical protein [Legionellales bacterium]
MALKRILIIISIFIFSVSLIIYIVGNILDQNPTSHPRRAFLNAEKALQSKNYKKFKEIETQLINYPLYPYLLAEDISSRINDLPETEVSTFLQNYGNTAAADTLRTNWLLALAHAGKWHTFTQYYQKTKNTQLQCLYANALYQTNQKSKAYQLGRQLWLVPKSQDNACDVIFKQMKESGYLTKQLIWQRFLLTIQHGKLPLANYLRLQLTTEQQIDAGKWITIKQNPEKINDTKLFPADINNNNAILTYGLEKLAEKNPQQAVTAWDKLQNAHSFTHQQTQKIIQAIAIGFIKTTHQKSIPWLHQINPKYLNDIAMSWRLRFALIENNWRGLLHWIDNLPIKQQQSSEWQYWKAQALTHLHQTKQAKLIYQHLAKKRDYYGFLAADKLNIPYPIHNLELPISQQDYDNVANHPGFLRAKELFALKRYNAGIKEWWHTLLALNEKDRYIAARLANQQHWTAIALATTGFIAHQDDLQLRFPRFYLNTVMKQAQRFNLQPEFIYAIIRQESMFKADAQSYAGAMGLMQLMPSTANMLIQQDNLPANLSQQLHKPEVNILLGSQYLNRLMKMNNNSAALTAASYNAGPGRVNTWLPKQGNISADVWIDSIPYPETRNYVKNVMTYAVIYQYLMGQKPKITNLMPPVTARTNQ